MNVDEPTEQGGSEMPRRTGASGPGSAAAAQGEAPEPAVEQTQAGEARPRPPHERPVTGVHRASAPTGEVSPE